MSKLLYDSELLETLCNTFGPSGCEDAVALLIGEQISPICPDFTRDRLGNVIAKLSFGEGNNKPRLMLSAHMDEVGFMITEVCEDGYLRFSTVGGISDEVLCGRHVTVGEGENAVNGVIASKAIHHKSREERKKPTPIDKLYIDIGAHDAEEARKHADIGTFAAFSPNFMRFGKDSRMIASKALDDRLGCALLIELMRELHSSPPQYPIDVYFCFTVREEVGLSGASVAAQTICPDYAVAIETTAVADVYGVPENSRVASLGDGGAISVMDRSTIYDRALVDAALLTAKEKGISAQIKKYVSGGNDSAHIQTSGVGVRMLALSAPTRYLHSPSCVACYDDYTSMITLLEAMIKEERFK